MIARMATAEHGQPAGKNQAQNIARLSAKAHANANFLRALAHRIGHDAIGANGGKNESEESKSAEQFGADAWRGERLD